jgi:tRNA-dihydrouridine synthase
MADYIDNFIKYEEGSVHSITRHILGLYNSLPGAKYWRQELSENARFSKNGDILRFATENIEKFINKKNSVLI